MSINIFNLVSCQPLVWLVLALVALIGIPNVLFYRELSGGSGYYSEERKHIKIFNWVLSVVIVALWAAVVVANHTTVWQDIINFAFLAGFSFVFAIFAVVAFVLVVSGIVFILIMLYYVVSGIIALLDKVPHSESETSFFDNIE